MQKPKVIVIGGPTASGKTALSIELAKAIGGEIVSADSMQIYQEMNIGTAKPEEEEKQGIPHYMIDVVKPNERYSVAEYKKEAKKAIKEILQKGKVPIVVGGTGLYIDSLIYEIEFLELETPLTYRRELEQLAEKEGLESLYQKAKQIDPEAMEKISQNDKKRIFRVLEIYRQTGKTKTTLDKESRKEAEYEYKMFAIGMDREMLYHRINERVDNMIEKGLIEEVQRIYQNYQEFPTAMQALGYKEVVAYLERKSKQRRHDRTDKKRVKKICKKTTYLVSKKQRDYMA